MPDTLQGASGAGIVAGPTAIERDAVYRDRQGRSDRDTAFRDGLVTVENRTDEPVADELLGAVTSLRSRTR